MLRGLYTAASGMLSTQMAVDTLASNLANVNTTGFKANKINYQSFPEMLISRISQGENTPVGSVMTGSQVYETFTSHKQGNMLVTGNTFDMALEGNGFFTIKMPNGQMGYTRAGSFTVNGEGFITTLDGNKLQGDLGDIQLNLDEGPFNLTPGGELSGKNRQIDHIKVTRFVDDHALQKLGDNLFIPSDVAKEIPKPANGAPQGYKVHQGMLEQSNVNPVMELINNIQGMRLYEALQKDIHLQNETLGKAVNDVGRYR